MSRQRAPRLIFSEPADVTLHSTIRTGKAVLLDQILINSTGAQPQFNLPGNRL